MHKLARPILLATLLAACGVNPVVPDSPAEVDSAQVEATQTVLDVGETLALHVTAWSADGRELTDPAVDAWSSSDPAVLSVSDAGLATALAPGFATVAATIGAVAASVDMTVVATVPHVRILAVGGDAVRSGQAMAAADSFVVTVRISLPDTAAPGIAVWVAGAEDGTWGASIAAAVELAEPFASGTLDTTLVGYNAPAGGYDLVPMVVRGFEAEPAVGEPVPVTVTNSDVTSPAVRFVDPADGAVVPDDRAGLVFEAEDAGGVWDYEVTFDWRVDLGDGLFMGPVAQGGSLSPSERVALLRVEMPMPEGMRFREGENRIVVAVRDLAWNRTVDTLTVVYTPPATAGALAGPVARRTEPAVCVRRIGPDLCIEGEDAAGRRTFRRRR